MTASRTTNTRGLSSVVIAWAYALLPANLIPTIIARLVNDYSVDLTTAGFLATGMTLINSATVLLVRPWVRRHSRTPVALAGVAVLMLVSVAGIILGEPGFYGVLLLIAGLGSGLVLGAASASISATENPDRSANVAMIFNRLVVAAAYFLVPLIGGTMNSVLLIMCIPGAFVLLTARWLPEAAEAPVTDVSAGKAGKLAWILAVAFGAWSITDDGIIGLSELIAVLRFGEGGSPLVMNLLAIATLAGLAGAVITPVAEKKAGRVPLLAVALGISLVSKVVMVVAGDTALFSVVFVAWGFAFGMSLPLVFGLAAILTRDGSASVAVNGVYILGVALGPLVATQIFDLGGDGTLAVVMAVLGVVTAAAIVVIALRVGREAAAAGETAVSDRMDTPA